jgi:hypothetical protein
VRSRRCLSSSNFRIGDIHVSQCQERVTRFLWARSRAPTAHLVFRSQQQAQHTPIAFTPIVASLSPFVYQGLPHAQQLPLGWWSLHPAGPDIHLLSKTPKSPHRRLSLCSLPVPKQFEESLRSLISFAQSPYGGTWQPAHRNNPDVFPS